MNSNKILLTKDDVLNTYKSKKHGEKALSKYIYWFPITTSQRLAGIVADLMGDGHLQGYPRYRIDYTSNSIIELERFNSSIYHLFKIKGKIRKCTTNKYGTMNLGVNNKPLSRTLKQVGVPVGNKVLSSFSIPNWILTNKLFFSYFINRLISCEGNVDLFSKCIELRMHKSLDKIDDGMKFFEDIKNHLELYFNVKSTRPFLTGDTNTRKDGIKTKGIRIKIKRKESLVRFKKYINIENKEKRERLRKIC